MSVRDLAIFSRAPRTTTNCQIVKWGHRCCRWERYTSFTLFLRSSKWHLDDSRNVDDLSLAFDWHAESNKNIYFSRNITFPLNLFLARAAECSTQYGSGNCLFFVLTKSLKMHLLSKRRELTQFPQLFLIGSGSKLSEKWESLTLFLFLPLSLTPSLVCKRSVEWMKSFISEKLQHVVVVVAAVVAIRFTYVQWLMLLSHRIWYRTFLGSKTFPNEAETLFDVIYRIFPRSLANLLRR